MMWRRCSKCHHQQTILGHQEDKARQALQTATTGEATLRMQMNSALNGENQRPGCLCWRGKKSVPYWEERAGIRCVRVWSQQHFTWTLACHVVVYFNDLLKVLAKHTRYEFITFRMKKGCERYIQGLVWTSCNCSMAALLQIFIWISRGRSLGWTPTS